jgi:hypothetical protein
MNDVGGCRDLVRSVVIRELALSGCVEDRLDQQAGAAVVDAGDGAAKADGDVVGEAEHSPLVGERRVLAAAASIAVGIPVDLRDTATGRHPG